MQDDSFYQMLHRQMRRAHGLWRSALVAPMLALVIAGSAHAQEAITDEMIASADLDKGKRVYLRCRSCHTLGEGERHLQGPNLWGLFGRKVGSVDDFRNYSPAVLETDFIWSPDKLDAWLQSPNAFLPGNRMSFQGLPKEADRVNLIAYLVAETTPAETASTGEAANSNEGDAPGEEAADESKSDGGDKAEPAASQ